MHVIMDPASRPESVAIFSAEHVVAISAIALCTALLVGVLRRGGPRVRRSVCWGLAALLILAWAAGQVQRVWTGTWTLQESLPLHLCNLGLFVAAITLVIVGWRPPPAAPTGAVSLLQRLFELTYFWAIGGTSQAILTPDVEGRFPAFSCVRYFVEHGGLLAAVFVLLLGLRMRPVRGAVLRAWVTTMLLAVVVFAINVALDANYMYLLGPPKNPTLYDAFGPWPWALITLVVVGTLIFLLCYAPFWSGNRRGHAGSAGV